MRKQSNFFQLAQPTLATQIFERNGLRSLFVRLQLLWGRKMPSFSFVQAAVRNHFNQKRTRYFGMSFKANRAADLADWHWLYADQQILVHEQLRRPEAPSPTRIVPRVTAFLQLESQRHQLSLNLLSRNLARFTIRSFLVWFSHLIRSYCCSTRSIKIRLATKFGDLFPCWRDSFPCHEFQGIRAATY